MGLDIVCMKTTPAQLLNAVKQNECGHETQPIDLATVNEWIAGHHAVALDECIHTRPGSYHGLHIVRNAFAVLKGIPLTSDSQYVDYEHVSALTSHLINHSDAEGWYLPDDFIAPITMSDLSVGSGFRLAAELRELDAANVIATDRWRLLAVLVPALACVYCRDVVQFR